MKIDTKSTVIWFAVLLALFRSLFFSNSDASNALKFLSGVAVILIAYTVIDSVMERSKIHKRNQEKRLKMLCSYYEQMLKIEQDDPRRLRHLGDVEEFMNLYSEYKRLKDQGAHITGITPNERR